MADQEDKAGLLLFLTPNDIIQAVTKKRAAGLPRFKMPKKKKVKKANINPNKSMLLRLLVHSPGSRVVAFKNRHTRSRSRRCLDSAVIISEHRSLPSQL